MTQTGRRQVLLLSAYDAASHRYWHQQLCRQFSDWEWTVLTLKDRFFTWRMGGNALSFQTTYPTQLSARYDLMVSTSMTDLASLRGLFPALCEIPNLLYFHENQFAYPANQRQQGLTEIQLRSILSATCADRLAFNSAYNRDSFLSGLDDFLRRMPDGTPDDLAEQLTERSTVLPVPLSADCLPTDHKPSRQAIQIVWNHRWEHDKGPEVLLELMRLCQDHPVASAFRFHLLGQRFRTTPPALQDILDNHQSQLAQSGFLSDRQAYLNTLQQADVVLSTAVHDFQGLAVQEAVACGCVPLVPNRLVYPEWYPPECLYPSTPEDPAQEARHILAALMNLPEGNFSMEQLKWPALLPAYQQWLT